MIHTTWKSPIVRGQWLSCNQLCKIYKKLKFSYCFKHKYLRKTGKGCPSCSEQKRIRREKKLVEEEYSKKMGWNDGYENFRWK